VSVVVYTLAIVLVVLGMLAYTNARDTVRMLMQLQLRPSHLLPEDAHALEQAVRSMASLAIVVGLAMVALVTVV
jgi:hypothetical protein